MSARKGGFHPQWQLTMIFYGVLVVIYLKFPYPFLKWELH